MKAAQPAERPRNRRSRATPAVILPFRRPPELETRQVIVISAATVRELAAAGLGLSVAFDPDGTPDVRARETSDQ
jgi:hypothetical protein